MPLSALVFYMQSKRQYEAKHDAYLHDALYALNLALTRKGAMELPRWHEFVNDAGQNSRQIDYTAADVVDMFRGKGVLG